MKYPLASLGPFVLLAAQPSEDAGVDSVQTWLTGWVIELAGRYPVTFTHRHRSDRKIAPDFPVPNPMEQLYQRFIKALPISDAPADQHLHLLSPAELHRVRKTERWAQLVSVLIELAAYLVIFIPLYAFPDFFDSGRVSLGGPFVGFDTSLEWGRNGWMLLVTLAELYLLLMLNLAAVHGIAVATGFIRQEQRTEQATHLIRIALERKFEEQQSLGLNPLQGMTPWLIFLLLLFNRFKGLIGSVIIRAALTNLFGREILRVYLDFSGMPFYMLINVLTTRAILHNARVIIMGQTAIELMQRQFPNLALDAWERELLYDTLQFIAINKRDFHANHYYLARAFLEHYSIPVKPEHTLPGDYLHKLKQARKPVADLCRLGIVTGFLLDGRVSGRELQQLDRLRRLGLVDVTSGELKAFARAFVDGQGLSGLMNRYLPAR